LFAYGEEIFGEAEHFQNPKQFQSFRPEDTRRKVRIDPSGLPNLACLPTLALGEIRATAGNKVQHRDPERERHLFSGVSAERLPVT